MEVGDYFTPLHRNINKVGELLTKDDLLDMNLSHS